MAPPAASPRPGSTRLKASTLRSYITVLAQENRREAVMALVPPATASLIANPPLPSTWVPIDCIAHIAAAMETLAGMQSVRDLARKAFEDTKGPHIRMLEGLMRLIGTSPATVFKRFKDLSKHTIENCDYAYTVTSQRSGVMEMYLHADYEIPYATFVAAVAAFQGVLDACGVDGIIAPPERLGSGGASYRMQW